MYIHVLAAMASVKQQRQPLEESAGGKREEEQERQTLDREQETTGLGSNDLLKKLEEQNRYCKIYTRLFRQFLSKIQSSYYKLLF